MNFSLTSWLAKECPEASANWKPRLSAEDAIHPGKKQVPTHLETEKESTKEEKDLRETKKCVEGT